MSAEKAPVHDDQMPQGWHQIKGQLLTEIRTAANFHLCKAAADALFHARLIGEGIAREWTEMTPESTGRSALRSRTRLTDLP